MRSLKKFLFRDSGPAALADDVRAALDAWRAAPEPRFDDLHFHTRYVVVDIVSTGFDPGSDALLGIAACSVERGVLHPDGALFIDLGPENADPAAVDRQLAAFLLFLAKAPLVTYHVSYVGGFLKRVFRERLGIDFEPAWIDLAWLLPSMFEERSHQLMPLDQWLELFGLDGGEGRRDAMANTLLLARIFQMLLVRAVGKQIDTAARLVEESRASTFLRRTH